jgi:hypothetical protein
MEDLQLSLLLNMENPESVFDEVWKTLHLKYKGLNFGTLEDVFKDIQRLYNGEYPGYRKCNTEYHNLKHSTDAFLAMARLLHGAYVRGEILSTENVSLGLVCALMHDTGYIQTIDDGEGTGAKYTRVDTLRSIDFMGKYIADHGLPEEDFRDYALVLKGTSLDAKISEIQFRSRETELLCKMVGTADLLGQMADRIYLEKLLFLFYEFVEAGIGGYYTELELLKKTLDFYAMARARLTDELGDVKRFMLDHFQARWNLDRELYMEAIEKNITYLEFTLENYEKEYRDHLRRAGIVEKIKKRDSDGPVPSKKHHDNGMLKA